MMTVLGSTYLPIMDKLASKIDDIANIRPFSEDMDLSDQLAGIDILMLGHQKVMADDLAGAPLLKLIHQHGRGGDSVDLAAAAEAGVTVANVPGGNSVAVAEHSLALMLSLAKNLHLAEKSISERKVGAPGSIELRGKTLAIIGLGASGTELARLAGFMGMKVLAIKRHPDVKPDVTVDALYGPNDLHEVLEQADFVVLLATLAPETMSMIGKTELAMMKPAAYLINSARGALVDYDALFACLQEGNIAGAAFDTFWREPADPDDRMLGLENFLLTPHVAGFSDASVEHVTDAVAQNICRLKNGEALLNTIGVGGAA
ncbi:MAG: hydroxyacid dehydrogenase [Gammaproteobacteria bacterium]|nr:hydroxyacid dehydrogenase [Gammaproteobacteria bacterium]